MGTIKIAFNKQLLRYCIPLVVLCSYAHAAPTEHLQIAINPPPDIHSLSLNEARSIFSMRIKIWPEGSPITVFVLPSHTQKHTEFVKKQLKLLPHQLKRNWDRMVYTGTGMAPIEVANEQVMLERLKRTPGSIGYISKEVAHDQLRIIEVH